MVKKTDISVNSKTILELDNFNPMRAELQKFADDRKGLVIKGVDDKKGYDLLHTARMELVKKRTQVIEAERKRIVAQPNEFVSKINAEAKALTEIIRTVEKDLHDQEKVIDDAKAKIKKDKELAEQKIVQDRLDKFAEWDYRPEYIVAKMMSDEQFTELLGNAKTAYEDKKKKEQEEKKAAEKKAEDAKKAAEQLKKDQDKLAADKKILDDQKAKQIADQKKIDDANKKLEDDKKAAEVKPEVKVTKTAPTAAKIEVEVEDKKEKYKQFLV